MTDRFQYGYDGDDNILTMQATFPGTGTPNENTAYIYGVGSTIGTDLFNNDLVAKIEYPDKSTGAASSSASNDVSYTYNLQGETTGMTDENGTVHSYNYDVLGRLTADIITTLGTGVDGTIRRLGYSYTALVPLVPARWTSYSNTGGTTVVNQVQDDYNGYGQLIDQYQEHSGAVNTGSSLKVAYAYSQPSGSNYSRLSSITYPNGRVEDYNYNSGIDTNISRVSSIEDDAGTGSGNGQSYTYLGLDTIVQYADGNGIDLTYIQQSGDTLYSSDGGDRYTGLNRFGEVIDQFWVNDSGSARDRFQYGYDRDGNVLYKNNLLSGTFSELYHANSSASGDNNTAYDNLSRLTAFRRGTLSASANNSGVLDTVGTLNTLSNSSQSYTLDAVGNATSVTTDGTATSRTVNSQNEVTAVGSTSLAYDNNGNTTTDDQNHTLVYNAWNQIVAVKNGGTTIASYVYDANGNRIQQTESSTTTDFYFSSAGQDLEDRQSGTVVDQYVWGLGYVNNLVLRDDNSSSGSYGKSSSGLGRRLFVQQDAGWNVTALVNTSGTVLERFIQTPYGVTTVLTAAWASTTDSYSWVYGFQGGRYDPVTGMFQFGARDFSPTLERWVEHDPAGYIDGPNVYQAMLGAPISKVDPYGLDTGYTDVASGNATPASQPTPHVNRQLVLSAGTTVLRVKNKVRYRLPGGNWKFAVPGDVIPPGSQLNILPFSYLILQNDNGALIYLGNVTNIDNTNALDFAPFDFNVYSGDPGWQRQRYEIEAPGVEHDWTIRLPNWVLGIRG